MIGKGREWNVEERDQGAGVRETVCVAIGGGNILSCLTIPFLYPFLFFVVCFVCFFLVCPLVERVLDANSMHTCAVNLIYSSCICFQSFLCFFTSYYLRYPPALQICIGSLKLISKGVDAVQAIRHFCCP